MMLMKLVSWYPWLLRPHWVRSVVTPLRDLLVGWVKCSMESFPQLPCLCGSLELRSEVRVELAVNRGALGMSWATLSV